MITRTGEMLTFKRGIEKIAAKLDAPIVPIHLDRVWGSIFSFSGRRIPREFPYRVTVSIGVASFPDETTSPHQLVRAADERLYLAKGSGRNRVVGA
jgi:acyl-[acyl-carrier-protein]-phospholipid O-acyltransferase/long-chain-fatty-acid--[acyl-carrier-protein] ligase